VKFTSDPKLSRQSGFTLRTVILSVHDMRKLLGPTSILWCYIARFNARSKTDVYNRHA